MNMYVCIVHMNTPRHTDTQGFVSSCYNLQSNKFENEFAEQLWISKYVQIREHCCYDVNVE